MKKYLYILCSILIVSVITGCKSKEKKVDKVMANKEKYSVIIVTHEGSHSA